LCSPFSLSKPRWVDLDTAAYPNRAATTYPCSLFRRRYPSTRAAGAYTMFPMSRICRTQLLPPSTPLPSATPSGGRPTPTRAAGRASAAHYPTSGSNPCAFVARSAAFPTLTFFFLLENVSFLLGFLTCPCKVLIRVLFSVKISLTCSLAASFRPTLGS
jgi:hypothetical protein